MALDDPRAFLLRQGYGGQVSAYPSREPIPRCHGACQAAELQQPDKI
jgi:hypothetical protein